VNGDGDGDGDRGGGEDVVGWGGDVKSRRDAAGWVLREVAEVWGSRISRRREPWPALPE